jgi:hypothetical protein
MAMRKGAAYVSSQRIDSVPLAMKNTCRAQNARKEASSHALMCRMGSTTSSIRACSPGSITLTVSAPTWPWVTTPNIT